MDRNDVIIAPEITLFDQMRRCEEVILSELMKAEHKANNITSDQFLSFIQSLLY